MRELVSYYKNLPTVKIHAGESLFMQGEKLDTAYAVKSGVVRAYVLTSNHEERSISFVVENEILPIYWLFHKSDHSMFFYIAHTDCELYVLDRDSFHNELENSPNLAYAILEHSVNDHVMKALQISALEQVTARTKLLHTLEYFVLRYGIQILNDTRRINIQMTQKDIASFAGLTRETTAVEIGKLRRLGLLSVTNRFYTINYNLLREIIKEAKFEIDIKG